MKVTKDVNWCFGRYSDMEISLLNIAVRQLKCRYALAIALSKKLVSSKCSAALTWP